MRLGCGRIGSFTRDGSGGWVCHPDSPSSRRGDSSARSGTPSSRRSTLSTLAGAAYSLSASSRRPRVLFPIPANSRSDTADDLPLHLLRGPSSRKKNNEKTESVKLDMKKKAKRINAGQRAGSSLKIKESELTPDYDSDAPYTPMPSKTARRAFYGAMCAVASTDNRHRSTQQRASAALKAAKRVAKEPRKRVMANERKKEFSRV